MRGIQQLPRSRSSCLASRKALQPRSGWRQLDLVLTAVGALLLGQACFSEWRRVRLFPRLFLTSFSLLPVLLSLLLFQPSLTASPSSAGCLSFLISGLALQQPRAPRACFVAPLLERRLQHPP